MKVGLGKFEVYLWKDDGAAGDGFHAVVVDDGLVGVVATGAFGTLDAVVALLGEVHFVDHIAADDGAIKLIEAFFISASL